MCLCILIFYFAALNHHVPVFSFGSYKAFRPIWQIHSMQAVSFRVHFLLNSVNPSNACLAYSVLWVVNDSFVPPEPTICGVLHMVVAITSSTYTFTLFFYICKSLL